MQEAIRTNELFCFWIEDKLLKMYPFETTEKYVSMCTEKKPNEKAIIVPYTPELYEGLKHLNVVFYFHKEEIIPFDDYSENAWDKYSDCEGCRYGYSNQQGHTC